MKVGRTVSTTVLLAAAILAVSFAATRADVDQRLVMLDEGRWVDEQGEPLEVPAIVEAADADTLVWSPDGTEVAFACDSATLAPDPEGRGLCSVDVDTSNSQLRAEAAAPVRFPIWSPDGNSLAYAALGLEGHGSLWVTNPSAPGGVETLCEDWCPLFRYYSLAWSPDGSTIATSAETPGTGGHPARIILFDVASHEFELLANDLPGLQHAPTWSPDGEQLAFSSNAVGGFDLWSVDISTREPRQLTTEDHGALNPAWAPDGSELVFVSRTDGGGTNVRSVSSSGGPSTEILSGDVRSPRFILG